MLKNKKKQNFSSFFPGKTTERKSWKIKNYAKPINNWVNWIRGFGSVGYSRPSRSFRGSSRARRNVSFRSWLWNWGFFESERGKKEEILGFLYKQTKKNCAFGSGCVLKGKRLLFFFFFFLNFQFSIFKFFEAAGSGGEWTLNWGRWIGEWSWGLTNFHMGHVLL